MERIALIIGNTVIYCRPLVIVAAAITAALLFTAIYLTKGGKGLTALLTVTMSMILGIVLSRLLHWYSRFDSYSSLQAALTDYSSGAYALAGAFAGCFVTALLLRILFVHRNLGTMLDCMSIAGCAGIAVGRLASFFDASARGPILSSLWQLPWAWPVTNPVSGLEENRLAVFLIQAIIAAALFAALLLLYLIPRWKTELPEGNVTLIFLLVYGASQVILDSTRYDSLFFRSNGFVSIVQVLGATAIVIPTFIFSVRMIKNRGMKKAYAILWILFLAAVSLAGYMEYFVQRHGSQAFLGYCIMAGSLTAAVILSLVIHRLSLFPRHLSGHGRFLKSKPGSYETEDL